MTYFMRTLAAILIAVFGIMGFGGPAVAQQQQSVCTPYQEMVDALESEYKEAKHWQGMETRGVIVRLYVNAESGSWSMITVNPNGSACLFAAGEGSTFSDVVEPVKGDPA